MAIDLKDQKILQLEQKLNTLEQVVKHLAGRVQFLERENNRRRNEINQVSNHLRKN